MDVDIFGTEWLSDGPAYMLQAHRTALQHDNLDGRKFSVFKVVSPMTLEKNHSHEEDLDPQDWESMRVLGHQMVDDLLDHLQGVRERPAWQAMPPEAKARFTQPVPWDPQEPQTIYEEFKELIQPYPVGNTHPRFWGWVFGSGTLMGAYAELLAAGMNTNGGDLDNHSAIHVETQVVNWLKELLGFPASASGLLTNGCSAANLNGLAVARHAKTPWDIRRVGLQSDHPRLTLYASSEAHSSIRKAVELLGLGSEALRSVAVDAEYCIDLAALEVAIQRDRETGSLPFCVVGSAGTVNTGAFDDLNALADLCQAQDLWLHVDGAFGAWAVLAPSVRRLADGLARADSLAFDLHKWMYIPYELGCVLVRDENLHRQAFSYTPPYLAGSQSRRGLTGGDLPWFTDKTFELSRGFRALKAWMSLKEHGVGKYARLIEQNVQQARYLAEQIAADPVLELMAPAPLNVVCFRYAQPGLDEAALEALNQEILVALQEQGIAVLSSTRLAGRFVLRVGHTNQRTRRVDFDLLVKEVKRLGTQLANPV
jgi:aromatic-L-amino-acid decarboxylase